jgi:predicted transposase/invertase (TIGR01784 family)
MRHDTDNGLFNDSIQVVYIELSKLSKILQKPVETMTDLEKWALFFRYAEDPRYRGTINKVIESEEALNMAGELLMSVSQDEHERARQRSRRMYQTDMESNRITEKRALERNFRKGHAKGKAEGKAEGRADAMLEVARNLKNAKTMTDKEIAKLTGLSPAEIEKL